MTNDYVQRTWLCTEIMYRGYVFSVQARGQFVRIFLRSRLIRGSLWGSSIIVIEIKKEALDADD